MRPLRVWLVPSPGWTWREWWCYGMQVLWRHIRYGHECFTCSDRNIGSHLSRIHECECGKDMTHA